MASTQEVTEVEETVRSIVPMLAGKHPAVQGAILADLTSIWVIGHHGPDEAATVEVRDGILEMHLKYVRQLMVTNDITNEKLVNKLRKEMAN